MSTIKPTLITVPCFAGAPWDERKLTPPRAYPVRTMRLPEAVDDVNRYSDFLAAQVEGLSDYVLVGDSFGAVISLALAVRRSDDVSTDPGNEHVPARPEGVTTTALAPRTRADANAGLGTVDDVRLHLASSASRARVDRLLTGPASVDGDVEPRHPVESRKAATPGTPSEMAARWRMQTRGAGRDRQTPHPRACG